MSAMCDVCSIPMSYSDGYALTTKEVTTNSNYWKHMIDKFSFDDQLLMMYVQQQAIQNTGWLICESCSRMFSFDKITRREYARRQQNPPGSGPADIHHVAAAAANAWQNKKGVYPTWVR